MPHVQQKGGMGKGTDTHRSILNMHFVGKEGGSLFRDSATGRPVVQKEKKGGKRGISITSTYSLLSLRRKREGEEKQGSELQALPGMFNSPQFRKGEGGKEGEGAGEARPSYRSLQWLVEP